MLKSTQKVSKITSSQAYERLENWHLKEKHKSIYELNGGVGIPALSNSYYTKTNDRFYLSKWLESVIKAYLKWLGWTIIEKADKGRKIKSKGREIYIRQKITVKGQADIVAKKPLETGKGTLLLNIEVKIGADKQSQEQIEEQLRCQKDGELYFIVKTLDDFFNLVDNEIR